MKKAPWPNILFYFISFATVAKYPKETTIAREENNH